MTIQANPIAPMPTAPSTTQESANPTHSKTIDRVVEKQDPMNDEIPMRTRDTRAANGRRGLGDTTRSCVRTWLFSPVESNRTSTADAATEGTASGSARGYSITVSCHVEEDGVGGVTKVIDSLARTHSGLVSSWGTTFSTTGAAALTTGATASGSADSHPPLRDSSATTSGDSSIRGDGTGETIGASPLSLS